MSRSSLPSRARSSVTAALALGAALAASWAQAQGVTRDDGRGNAIQPHSARAHVGKPRRSPPRDLGQRPEAFDSRVPLAGAPIVALARAPKAVPPAPAVARGLVQLARHSSRPVTVELDPQLGTLRQLRGRIANPATQPGDRAELARRWLEQLLPAFGLGQHDALELVERSRMTDPDGGLNLAYDFRYDGLPVWLAELRVQLDGQGALTAVHAARLSELQPARELRYGAEAALQRGAAALNARAYIAPPRSAGAMPPEAGRVYAQGEPELGVWVGFEPARRAGVLAWQVTHRTVEAGMPQIYTSYVDARDGSVLAQHRRVHSQQAPVERVTGTSRNHGGGAIDLDITRFVEDDVFVLLDISGDGPLWTQHAGNASIWTAPDEIFSFPLVGSQRTDDWPTDHAVSHQQIGRVLDYFREVHERNSWDGQGGELRVAVHLGQSMDNAFFADGPRPFMAINDDGKVFQSFSRCTDVLAHEVTHGVINTSANLIYQNQSGALNESIADVFGVMIDADNWILGEHCVRPPLEVVRSLETPALGKQPGHMDEYKDLPVWEDGGGVHDNSGIPNRAAFLLATATSRQLVERVWYRTLTRHLTREATFDDMARATVTACDELVFLERATKDECAKVPEAWAQVGVLALAKSAGGECPPKSSANGGVCACDSGFTPAADGSACIAYADVQCPPNAIQVQGECYCGDGFFGLGSECVAKGSACPPNSSPNMFGDCACDEGFQGSPFGHDGGCTAVPSDCTENAHPEWADPQGAPDDYDCLCNDGYVADAAQCVVPPGGCGNETFFGRCNGKSLVYCGEDGLTEVDCGGESLTCGLVDSRIGFDCVNPSGLGPAASCDPSAYQECNEGNPFCVGDADDGSMGFCSRECASQLDCGVAFGCCATVSDGTRACLPADYCAELLDVNVTCDDVEGGSNYYGACQGNTLRYCDPSTRKTLEIPCPRDNKVCGFASEDKGYACLPAGSAVVAPDDWCPLSENGQCDAPEQCPEGTDLLDCNPCEGVSEDGQCKGDVLKVCDPEAGLVTTDCSELPEPARCEQASGQAATCVPADQPGGGKPGGDAGANKPDGGKPDGETPEEDDTETASCSCRVGPGAAGARGTHGVLALLALACSVMLRMRQRARRSTAASR